MRRLRILFAGALLAHLALGFAPAIRADEVSDLAEKVRAQGDVIEDLRAELEQLRRNQEASTTSGSSAEGVTTEYVDQRIEDFETAPENRLFLAGYGTGQYLYERNAPSTFGATFNPSFHFRLAESLHFSGELMVGLGHEDGETKTEVELEFTQMDYLMTDWLTVTAGKFLVPFNTFGTRQHPQWINKMASAPPTYGGHEGGGIIPVLADMGAMLSGGVALWNDDAKLNYALYITNGPEEAGAHGVTEHEEEEGDEPLEVSLLEFEWDEVPDLNDNKSLGGRVGFLPIANLEIGASYRTGRTGGSGDRFHLVGADAWYQRRALDLRAEFTRLSRDARGINPDVWGYYLQAAYRLRYLFPGMTGREGFLGRLEPVLRWGEINDLPTQNQEQLALGLNYWLFPSAPLRVTYELNSGAVKADRVFIQLSYGF